MSGSHASPTPSLSESAWLGFATSGQLSTLLFTPSPSVSGSHASPTPSPSISAWLGFATSGQLSTPLSTPSPSLSGLQSTTPKYVPEMSGEFNLICTGCPFTLHGPERLNGTVKGCEGQMLFVN